MVNNYKRKTSQASWDERALARAMKEVKDDKKSAKSTAEKFGIPLTTLRRHLISGSTQKKLGRFVTIFTSDQENELLEYLFHMDSLFYGLSKDEFLKLVYQYAELNKISHPFKNKAAGRDWYKGFVTRHPELTLRKPEPTSVARARGFNKPQVYRFFDLLEEQIEKYGIDATRLFNMDETGIQTSSNKPPRVLTKTGKRQVGLISSTERGKTTTVVCCCSAAGSYLPPFMIFARKRFVPRLLDGAPPGTQGTCSDNGWINGPVFLEWLRFFIETVRPTEEKKIILVLDNHVSHKYLDALEFASQNHVIFISLAPHTTHKMQPLDRCIYGPLKTHFERAVATFQKAHAGRIINQSDVAKLFGEAYTKAASAQNAINGFRSCGLWPADRYIFDETDFMPATVTDNPIRNHSTIPQDQRNERDSQDNMLVDPSNAAEVFKTPSPSVLEDIIDSVNKSAENTKRISQGKINKDLSKAEKVSNANLTGHSKADTARTPSPSVIEEIIASARTPSPSVIEEIIASARTPSPSVIKEVITSDNNDGNVDRIETTPLDPNNDRGTGVKCNSISTPKNIKESVVLDLTDTHKSPLMIRPVPTVEANKTSRRRKTQKAQILTSTPIKNEQREKLKKKIEKSIKKEAKNLKKEVKNLKKEAKNLGSKMLKENKPKNKRSVNDSPKPSSSNIGQSRKIIPNGTKGKTQYPKYYCLFCMELYMDPPVEDWIQCGDCKRWAHEACSDFLGGGSYYCDECQQI